MLLFLFTGSLWPTFMPFAWALTGETSAPCCIHLCKIMELNRRTLTGNLVLQITEVNYAERKQSSAQDHTVPQRFNQHQTQDLHTRFLPQCQTACRVLVFLKQAVLQQGPSHPTSPLDVFQPSSSSSTPNSYPSIKTLLNCPFTQDPFKTLKMTAGASLGSQSFFVSRPLNNTGLNCRGPLICRYFSTNILEFFWRL